MTALAQVFTYADFDVRTILIDTDPWFVATDVCAVLDIAQPASSLRLLDDDEKGVHSMHTPGGDQQVTIINEPGLYSLILRSRKPEAKSFKRWITHDVLPAIRKTGRYETAPALPQSFAEALQLAADQAKQIETQAAQLAIAAPKAVYVDAFVDARGDGTTIATFGAQLGITEPKLRAWLLARKVLTRRTVADYIGTNGKRRVEYEWRSRAGYHTWFKTEDQPQAPRMHNGQLRTTLYVTPVGKAGITDLLLKHPIDGAA